MTQGSAWLDLLKSCKDTLLSLRLHLVYEPTHPLDAAIVLPILKCLDIQYWDTEPNRWPLKLLTPVLETYIERSEAVHTIPVHQDIAKVKFLYLDHAPTLSSFPMLVVLRLEGLRALDEVLSQITEENSLCPELTLIEVLAHLTSTVAEVHRSGRSKEITVVSRSLGPFVGGITKSPVGFIFRIALFC